FQCVRYEPKDFRQRRPDPAKPRKWIWNLKDVPRVLYRLPELKAAIAAAQVIYIAEGEKDVDVLVKYGFAATCNPMGAGKWLPEHTETLRGAARVVVIADKDENGRRHARFVATALHGVAKSVKLIELPDSKEKPVKDGADFFAAAGTADELRALAEAVPEFVPTGAENRVCPQDQDGVENESPDEEDSEKRVRKSAATRLIKFADEFAFFHDPQSRAFVRLDVNGHVEIWPVNSTQFRNLLAQTFYKRTRTAINRNALA